MKNKVNIITSLDQNTSIKSLLRLIEMGINEFYFGFIPVDWLKKYGWEVCVNRRPYPILPHILDIKKALLLIKICHKYNKKIFLAVNEHMYTKDQYKILVPLIRKMLTLKVDGIIVADAALIAYLKKHFKDIPLNLSVGAGVFNNQAIRFFAGLGIKRFTLSRQLHIHEIKEIIKNNPNSHFEVFLAGEWCPYNDAYCFNVHGYNKNEFCKTVPLKNKNNYFYQHPLLMEKINFPWCGICLLAKLKKYSLRITFKIPVRNDVFKKDALLTTIHKIINQKNYSAKSIQQMTGCKKEHCAYKL